MKIAYIALILMLFSCQQDYKVLYQNDSEGHAIVGSKAQLIQAVRAGASIKIGWGVKGKSHSIEHLSDPIWIAVLDEQEVIAHLDAQILSRTDWENLSANYSDSTLLQQEWRVVLTTKGEFDAVWYDRASNEVIRRRPQQHAITWFGARSVTDAPPLYSNTRL